MRARISPARRTEIIRHIIVNYRTSTIMDLADQLKISRSVIVKTVTQLIGEGKLEPKGKGGYVRAPKEKSPAQQPISLTPPARTDRGFGREINISPASAANKAQMRAEERQLQASVDATRMQPKCGHYWVCGDDSIAEAWPAFFDSYSPAPRGWEWQVCLRCGQCKAIHRYDEKGGPEFVNGEVKRFASLTPPSLAELPAHLAARLAVPLIKPEPGTPILPPRSIVEVVAPIEWLPEKQLEPEVQVAALAEPEPIAFTVSTWSEVLPAELLSHVQLPDAPVVTQEFSEVESTIEVPEEAAQVKRNGVEFREVEEPTPSEWIDAWAALKLQGDHLTQLKAQHNVEIANLRAMYCGKLAALQEQLERAEAERDEYRSCLLEDSRSLLLAA